MSRLYYKAFRKLFPRLINSKMITTQLRESGVSVGKGTIFFDAGSITVDDSRPELLSIGEFCKITAGTVILTHDYSRSVLRRFYGDIVGEARKTIIGNNVFIGMQSIILMGTEIGDNSIVGAGSICHGKYPSNSIIVGNPGKVIMTLDEYYNKRKIKTIEEAKILARAHYERFSKKPTIENMGWFFPLYLERDVSLLKKYNLRTSLSGDSDEEVISCFLNSRPYWASFDDFLDDCNLEDDAKYD